MIKTWVLVTIIFQMEGILMLPPVEFPTMDECFNGREIMVRELERDLDIKVGTNWQSVCIQKDLSLFLEGTKI